MTITTLNKVCLVLLHATVNGQTILSFVALVPIESLNTTVRAKSEKTTKLRPLAVAGAEHRLIRRVGRPLQWRQRCFRRRSIAKVTEPLDLSSGVEYTTYCSTF